MTASRASTGRAPRRAPAAPPVKRRRGLLRMSELARRAGVSPGTVKFYIRMGLIPPPALKTSRNMAYYEPAVADRIRLIKELQEKRYLPLQVIRDLLADEESLSAAESRTLADLGAAFDEAEEQEVGGPGPLSRAEALARFDLTPAELEFLEAKGIVEPAGGILPREDTALLEALDRVRRAGATRALFPLERAAALYLESIERLVRQEVVLFTRAVTGRVPEREVPGLARASARAMEGFLLLLRRRCLRRAVARK